MKILCLDVSSVSTGYCIMRDSKLLKNLYGKIEINKDKKFGERVFEFESRLKKIISKTKPDLIIIEDVYCKNVLTFKVLCMFHGIVFKLSWDLLKKDPFYMKTSVARKILEVKGKDGVFNLVVDQYKLKDFTFDCDNDITDSIAIGMAYFKKVELDGEDKKRIGYNKSSRKRARKYNKGSV